MQNNIDNTATLQLNIEGVEKIEDLFTESPTPPTLPCTKCLRKKPTSEFTLKRNSLTDYNKQCNKCNERAMAYRKRRLAAITAIVNTTQQINPIEP